MKHYQRRMAAGLLALGVFGGMAGPAQAGEKVYEANDRYEFVLTGADNPCTPEPDDITLSTTVHVVAKVWLNDDGTLRSNYANRSHSSGLAADGTGYVGKDQAQSHARLEGDLLYVTSDHKQLLVSQGADPNFFLRYKVNLVFEVDGPGYTVELVKDQAECR